MDQEMSMAQFEGPYSFTFKLNYCKLDVCEIFNYGWIYRYRKLTTRKLDSAISELRGFKNCKVFANEFHLSLAFTRVASLATTPRTLNETCEVLLLDEKSLLTKRASLWNSRLSAVGLGRWVEAGLVVPGHGIYRIGNSRQRKLNSAKSELNL